MTTLIQEYQRKINNRSRTDYIGYYPVTVRPISEAAKMKFAKELREESGNGQSKGRLFSLSEMTGVVKKFLTKEKLEKSPTFTKEIKIFYKEHAEEIENKRHYKAVTEMAIAEEFRKKGWFIGLHECEIEVGDFVAYEQKKKLSFEDIKDLREFQ